ncbi:MAG: hypothetical protein E7307_07620 [Butyrivibrio sp.]|nr:hypothetical protein [Butyrivibrio sp.]
MKVWGYLRILAAGIIMGFLLLTIVYMLPVAPMKANLSKDLETIEREGSYPNLIEGVKSTQLDNFTDTVMLSLAVYDGDEPANVKAASGNHYDDKNVADIAELKEYLRNGKRSETVSYAWYWHGYLIFIKPLLMFMGVNGIRITGMIASFILILVIVTALIKKGQREFIVPYLMAAAVINPLVVSMSMQYGTAWYTMLLFLLVLILNKSSDPGKLSTAFFAAGMAVEYFDLLTYPLVVYGIPATYMVYSMNKEKGWIGCAKEMITKGIAFLMGYTLMLLAKLAIIIAFVDKSVIEDAKSHIILRLSGEGMDTDIKRTDAIMRNITVLNNGYFYMVAAVAVIAVITVAALAVKKSGKRGINPAVFIPYMMIALIPFAWYFVLANHSHIHYFFTHRNLAVTACALGAGVLDVFGAKGRKA